MEPTRQMFSVRQIEVRAEVHQANTSLWLKEAGATPLPRAALCGDLTVVRLLLAHGADPLVATLDHTTPLMAASGVGWAEGFTFERSEDETVEFLKLLLDKGAPVNQANSRPFQRGLGRPALSDNDSSWYSRSERTAAQSVINPSVS